MALVKEHTLCSGLFLNKDFAISNREPEKMDSIKIEVYTRAIALKSPAALSVNSYLSIKKWETSNSVLKTPGIHLCGSWLK